MRKYLSLGSAMMMGFVATKTPGYDFLASAIQKTQTKGIKYHKNQDIINKSDQMKAEDNQFIKNSSKESRGRSETLSHDKDH